MIFTPHFLLALIKKLRLRRLSYCMVAQLFSATSACYAAEEPSPTNDPIIARKQANLYPNDPQAQFILAAALARTHQVEIAIPILQHAFEMACRDDPKVYFEGLIQKLRLRIQSDPQDSASRYHLAWTKFMLAQVLKNNEDRRSLNTVANQSESASDQPGPGSPTPASHAADAVLLLEKNLHDDPSDLWTNLDIVFMRACQTGNFEDALQSFQRCQQQHPTDPAPYYFLSWGYLKTGNLRKSMESLSSAISLR